MIIYVDIDGTICNEIKDEDIDELNRIVREGLIELYEEAADPSLKDLKDWQFNISKNHKMFMKCGWF